MDIFIKFIVLIISQCICISKHQGVHLKYIQFLCVNYISIQLGKKDKQKKFCTLVLLLPHPSLSSASLVLHLTLN